ncbi:MAG: hypothetical protein KJN62_02560, partial [Deltaproteobacteria bacterium]|nr:hypothetical protein [Deltaproteobacteria bacterium]
YEQYQDIFINGKIVKPANYNHFDCETRYTIIKKVLDKYNRPFTMLDIGASQGYYSFRTAYNYNSVCVMIEGNNNEYPLIGDQLLDLCKCNTSLDNIILFQKPIVIADLQYLSECEHFDVILALNILHWLGSNWKAAADAIIAMGNNIIIETPPQETTVSSNSNNMRRDIENYLLENGAQVIGTVKRHTSNTVSSIYLIHNDKGFIRRRTCLKPIEPATNHIINSTFSKKTMTKKADSPPDTFVTSNWVPGINLITFKMYKGAYPTTDRIKEAIKNLKNEKTNDWMPNNMIIQGHNIAMIDTDDPNHNDGGLGGGRVFSEKLLRRVLRFVDLRDPKKVERYFWEKIVRS